MTSSPSTGRNGPGWIRERIDAYERAWPLGVLAVGIALSILLEVLLGVLIWTAASPLYYAFP